MIVMLASSSVHPLAPVWFQARSSPKLLHILCFLPAEAGYFIGTAKKSTVSGSDCPPFTFGQEMLWFGASFSFSTFSTMALA